MTVQDDAENSMPDIGNIQHAGHLTPVDFANMTAHSALPGALPHPSKLTQSSCSMCNIIACVHEAR